MSRQTKGFFEEAGPVQSKSYTWHNSKHSRNALTNIAPNAASPALPPIPATTQSKIKLNAFQFQGTPSARHTTTNPDVETQGIMANNPLNDDRENMLTNGVAPVPDRSTSSGQRKCVPSPSHRAVRTKISLPHANTFPSTPSDHLTLDELIGHMPEKRQAQENDGPEEILGWNPNSSYSGESPSRKRKRAQSSSPEFPPATSERPRADETNAQPTPLVDPAAELWRRYGGEDGYGRDGLKVPGLGLAFQASPRQLETPLKSTGFRRWASTGNDWPSSKSKRVKTTAHADGSVWSHGPSKVAAMVEKMQASLAIQQASERSKPRRGTTDPSSSSPLPEARTSISPRRPQVQRTPSKQPAPPHAGTGPDHKRPIISRASSRPPSRHAVTARGSTVRTAASKQQLQHARSREVTPRKSQNVVLKTISQNQPEAQSTAVTAQDLDEFDADLSLDDLENIRSPAKTSDQSATIEHTCKSAEQPHDAKAASTTSFLHEEDFDDDMTIEDDDDFGLDEIDEQGFIAAAELCASQRADTRTPRKLRHPPNSHRSSHRSIKESQATNAAVDILPSSTKYRRLKVNRVSSFEHARSGSEVVLLCEPEDTRLPLTVTLRGSWINTPLAPGDILHVCPSPSQSIATLEREAPGQIHLDDSEASPLLVVHPDHMLSATTVADSFDCIRKAVLQDRIKVTGDTSKPMVYGKILHEVFQQALLANTWEEPTLHAIVANTVAAHLEDLWELGMENDVLAAEEIQAKMKEISAWAHVFVRNIPIDEAKLHGTKVDSLRIAVTGLVAIEEHVWSPMFGLKGNVDATVQLAERSHSQKTLIAPFEVKTGRTTNAPTHHAQTAMYTLLMSDRYDIPVKAGLLYYLESSNISHVHPSMNEIRQLLQQRNRLASCVNIAKHPSIAQKTPAGQVRTVSQATPDSGLPPMMKNPYKCGRCYAQQSCFAFHALCEDGNADSAGMIEDKKKDHSMIWTEALGHLLLQQTKSKDKDAMRKQDMVKSWFSKWDRLLTFEEQEGSKIRKELWTMSSHARESVGRGFANLRISQDLSAEPGILSSSNVDGIEGSSGKIHRYVYMFERRSDETGARFNEGTQLTPGEPVVVSSEAGQWALAIGYVISATRQSITVAVDRKLGNARQQQTGFDRNMNQKYQGIMQLDGKPSQGITSEQLYRLDKDEFSNGLSRVRANLVRLMTSHPIYDRLRELIIFGAQPKFVQTQLPQHLPPSQLGEMNDDQRVAASKVMSAEDYAMILGMPGTGKTTMIAHLIRALLADGKSILLTSYTHTAVDNILLKIRDIAPEGGILRFGMPTKIHPAVRDFCHLVSTPRNSIDEINDVYMRTQIVATTCMGTTHALFTRRVFDVCIVDEASQITLPISLAPLLSARKFILVGDHYQLPPLVQNQAALEGGLDMSLFRMLCEQQPQAIAELGKQYRMCQDIMSISSTLIYDGRLKCGNDTVANRSLQGVDMNELSRFHPQDSSCIQADSCWLGKACTPDNRVLFMNTDRLGTSAQEILMTSSKKMTNRLEGVLTTQLVLSLQALGIASNNIGVITLYRSQIAFLRQLFSNASIPRDVELDSADRFQGRDKECIIISMVRSNDAGIVGELIKDWRRLNVAFTRARSKLIVLGSRRTLANNELMAKFLQLMDENCWCVDLPAEAETCHGSAFLSTTQTLDNLLHFATAAHSPTKESPARKRKRLGSQSSPRREVKRSPASTARPMRPLQETASAGNRGRVLKQPGKVVKGSQSFVPQGRRKVKEQLAFEIMEDLMAEDWV